MYVHLEHYWQMEGCVGVWAAADPKKTQLRQSDEGMLQTLENMSI